METTATEQKHVRAAACSCGQLTLTTTGEPVRIPVCHCLACQRRTGSAFGVQARFPRDAVTVSGRGTRYRRTAESGKTATLTFCPDCGATVYYELELVPGFVGIPVGAFADPGFPTPQVSIYEEHRHPWVGLSADIAPEPR
jgi:hypothetical protein